MSVIRIMTKHIFMQNKYHKFLFNTNNKKKFGFKYHQMHKTLYDSFSSKQVTRPFIERKRVNTSTTRDLQDQCTSYITILLTKERTKPNIMAKEK